MTQASEGSDRQPGQQAGDLHSTDDAVGAERHHLHKLGQHIQRRYGAKPGVISLQGSHSLGGRIARLTSDRLPLLAAIQRQRAANGATLWPDALDLPYARLASTSELVSSPSEPTSSPAAPVTMQVTGAQIAVPPIAQAAPVRVLQARSSAAPPAAQPAPSNALAPASIIQPQGLDSPSAATQTGEATPQTSLAATPEQVQTFPKEASTVTPKPATSRPFSEGSSRSGRLALASPANLGAAIVQRHLSAPGGHPTSQVGASKIMSPRLLPEQASLDSQPKGTILHRQTTATTTGGAALSATSASVTSAAGNAQLTGPVGASAENRVQAALPSPANTGGSMPSMLASPAGIAIVQRRLPEASRPTQPDRITPLPAQPVQRSPVSLHRNAPASAASFDKAALPAERSPLVRRSSDLSTAIAQRHLSGTATQPMPSQATTPRLVQLATSPTTPTVAARSSDSGPARIEPSSALLSNMARTQTINRSTPGISSPVISVGDNPGTTLVQRELKGATSQAALSPTMPLATAPLSAQPGAGNPPSTNVAFTPVPTPLATTPLSAQQVSRSVAPSSSGNELLTHGVAEPPQTPSAHVATATVGSSIDSGQGKLGAAIVQRQPRGAPGRTESSPTATPLSTQPVSSSAEPVLRRNEPGHATGTDAPGLAMKRGATTTATSPMAESSGALGAPSTQWAHGAIVQRQRRGETSQLGQSGRPLGAVTPLSAQPLSPAAETILHRQAAMLPRSAEKLSEKHISRREDFSHSEPTAAEVAPKDTLPTVAETPSSLAANRIATAGDLPGSRSSGHLSAAIVQRHGEEMTTRKGRPAGQPAVVMAQPTRAQGKPETSHEEPVLRRRERQPGASGSTTSSLRMPVGSSGSTLVSHPGDNLGRIVVQRYLGGMVSGLMQRAATTGSDYLEQRVEPILRSNEPAGSIGIAMPGSLPTDLITPTEGRAGTTVAQHLDETRVQSQPSESAHLGMAQPVYPIQRRSVPPMGVDHLGLGIIHRQQAGPGGQMAERGLTSAQASPIGATRLAAQTNASGARAYPLARSTVHETGEWHQPTASTPDGFTHARSGGGEFSAASSELPLAHAKVQTKPMNRDGGQGGATSPIYASPTAAMPIQRATTTSAPPPPTNGLNAFEPSMSTASSAATPEINLEQLANAVYAIIEQRLVIERERMGL